MATTGISDHESLNIPFKLSAQSLAPLNKKIVLEQSVLSIFSACVIATGIATSTYEVVPLLVFPSSIGVVSPWRLARFLLQKNLDLAFPLENSSPFWFTQVFHHSVVLADVSRILTFIPAPGCPTIMVRFQEYLSRQQLTTFHVEIAPYFIRS